MKDEKHKGNHFLIYDSIQEVPVHRYFKFNLQVAFDAGIGSGLNGSAARMSEFREWTRKGRKAEALAAINNLEQSIEFILAGISPETNAFVCLVKEANGKPVEDLSVEGMKRYLDAWGKKGLTIGKITGWVNEIKKNFAFEVEQFFPEVGNSPQTIERALMLKRRTLAVLRYLVGQKEQLQTVEQIDAVMLEFIKPNIYGGHKGIEVQRTNGFVDTIMLIRKELNVSKDMTAHEFLKHCETVKEIISSRKKRK